LVEGCARDPPLATTVKGQKGQGHKVTWRISSKNATS